MTQYDPNWARDEAAKRDWIATHGMYRRADEHASCGVGVVVSIDGTASRKVVDAGIEALQAVWHRGGGGCRW